MGKGFARKSLSVNMKAILVGASIPWAINLAGGISSLREWNTRDAFSRAAYEITTYNDGTQNDLLNSRVFDWLPPNAYFNPFHLFGYPLSQTTRISQLADHLRKNEFVCAVPQEGGTLRPVDVAADDPRMVKLKAGYAVALSWQGFTQHGIRPEPVCLTLNEKKDINGEHYPVYGASFLYRQDASELPASIYHENRHHKTHRVFPHAERYPYYKSTRDVALDSLFDESVSFAGTDVARYLHDRARKHEPAVLTYTQAIINHFYDSAAIEASIDRTGEVPLLVRRTAFVALMKDVFAGNTVYLDLLKDALKEKHISGRSGDRTKDGFFDAFREKTGLPVGAMPGFEEYMRAHTALGHQDRDRSMADDAAILRQKTRDYGYLNFMNDVANAVVSDKGVYENIFRGYDRLEKSGDLSFPFVIDDLRSYMAYVRERVTARAGSTGPTALEALTAVERQLDRADARLCRRPLLAGKPSGPAPRTCAS